MKTQHTFKRGGIHPFDNKKPGKILIKSFALPRVVELNLRQSLGQPAKPIVKPGDHVSRYDLVAEATGPISANLHSPISGTVKSVGRIEATDGHPAEGIIIEADDKDHTADLMGACDEEPMRTLEQAEILSGEEIIEIIRKAGIVGLGGATFPTAAKLTPPPGSPQCEYLLINGAECEPYLSCDDACMRLLPDEIVFGIKLLLKTLGDGVKAIIGIEDNKQQAIDSMSRATQGHDNISVMAMKTRYPQGAEKMLTKTLTDREIAPGALPISQGVIILNVATTLAVYQAVVWNKPLVERVMTIFNPDGISGNYIVQVGTRLKDIVGDTDTSKIRKVISGGPMMGRALAGVQGATTKGMGGLLLLSSDETTAWQPSPCVRCGRCVEVCPIGLEPYLLARLSELDRREELLEHHVLDCMECGCCSYSCMSHRPLVERIRSGKVVARRK